MSNDFDFGRLYKGEEYQIDIQIPYVGETFDSFELKFFTDSATTFDVPSTQYTVSSSTVNVNVNEHDLDVLADGVLRYYIEYVVNGVTTILCTNTMHYLKTPDGYSGQTAQDIYYEGYEAGLNAAGGEYADGYNEGVSVQKSRLSSIVITENNTYTRADGYSAVTVNVPQTGSTFIAQTKNYNITQNGNTSISPDLGYDGITAGTISVNVEEQQDVDFLCFTAEEANSTVSLTIGEYVSLNLYVSTDNKQTFTQWDGSEIVLHNIGDKVYMYGHNAQISFYNDSSHYCVFKLTGKIAASGNIESLLNRKGVDFIAAFSFNNLFSGCTSLTTVPELPAINLSPRCYMNMFRGCTNITEAPVLPATTLAHGCYYQMFRGCISLTQAPLLPATKLASRCYGYMFYGCSNITAAPVLPAQDMAEFCYEYMFANSSQLNYVKVGATTWNSGYTNNWLTGVAENGTFVKPLNTEIPSGTRGIPSGWTVVNE